MIEHGRRDGVCTYFPNTMGQNVTLKMGKMMTIKQWIWGIPHFQTDSFTCFLTFFRLHPDTMEGFPLQTAKPKASKQNHRSQCVAMIVLKHGR